MLVGHGWVVFQELRKRVTGLKGVEQVLQRDTRAAEDRHAALNQRIALNDRRCYADDLVC